MAERKTDRQQKIMAELAAGELDMDQLLLALPDIPTRQAGQCSVRFLERHGCVTRRYEIRRSRKRMVLTVTAYGLSAFGLTSGGSVSGGASGAVTGFSPDGALPTSEDFPPESVPEIPNHIVLDLDDLSQSWSLNFETVA